MVLLLLQPALNDTLLNVGGDLAFFIEISIVALFVVRNQTHISPKSGL